MINKMLGATGLVAVILGTIGGAAMADPYWGYGYDRYDDARHEQHRAFRQHEKAAVNMMEGRFGEARYHEHQARRAQREANYDRFGY